MSRTLWLLRRELWEHRAFVFVPLITGALLLLFTILVSDDIVAAVSARSEDILALEREKLVAALGYLQGQLAILFGIVLSIVVFFYLLDCLYAEREDRSILFWKSLPVSDLETVLSKLAMALVVAPAIVLASTVVFYLVLLIVLSVDVTIAGLGAWQLLWAPNPFLGSLGFTFYALVVQALWHFPLFAWLLLASAYARRGVFLWAVLPPLAVVWLEGLFFGSHVFAELLKDRLVGVFPLAFDWQGQRSIVIADDEATIHLGGRLSELIDPQPFLASPGLWGGLLVGGLLTLATIWLRRFRDESL